MTKNHQSLKNTEITKKCLGDKNSKKNALYILRKKNLNEVH